MKYIVDPGEEANGRDFALMIKTRLHNLPNLTVTPADVEPLQVRDTMPADGGWIEWKGGECPVDGGAVVLVRSAGGDSTRLPAHLVEWRHDDMRISPRFFVVAYKVLP